MPILNQDFQSIYQLAEGAPPAASDATAPKPRYPHSVAMAVARALVALLQPYCERITIAGSLRRLKPTVGDIEILYIPTLVSIPDGLFDTKEVNAVDGRLDQLIGLNLIAKRLNIRGSETWGAKNKLASHVASSIPVDFFTATKHNWFNYLVCRTGSAENNIRIASAAQAKGWKWHPYAAGFTDHNGHLIRADSEARVFECAGLPYLAPNQR